MTNTARLLVLLVLSLCAVPVAASQGAPEAFQVVERFTASLNEGHVGIARALHARDVVWAEVELHWRVATGHVEAGQRAIELIRTGLRLESDLVAVVGDGTMVVAHERMWGADVPAELAPLRSTTVYLVQAGRLSGITRVLASDQRDALLTAASVGLWTRAGHVVRIGADGTYQTFHSRADLLAGRSYDGGTFVIAGGVATFVSGEGSEVCDPGDRSAFRLQMTDGERLHLDPVQGEIECAHRRYVSVTTYERVAEE